MNDPVRILSPAIRGVTRTGRYGLHVRFVPDESAGGNDSVPVLDLSGADLKSPRDAASAFVGITKDGRYPGAVAVTGVGWFGLGEDIDTATANAEAAAAGKTTASPGAAAKGKTAADKSADDRNLRAGRRDTLAGAIAAVTGGAQGFGEEIVRYLIDAGATVFVVDLNEAGARSLCDSLNSDAGKTVAVPVGANVTDEGSVSEMVGRIVEYAGGLDLFVSNAGVLKAGSVKELDLKSFEFVTSVNYTGYFLGVKHVAPVMAAQHEANGEYLTDIIQINSKSGLEGSNKNGAYAGGKFGGIGLTQSFALELVEDGIKVNSICPGNFFSGPLWSDPEKGLFVQYLQAGKVPGAKSVDDVRAFYEAKVPMKRGCTGADVMKAIYYIVDQTYETGQAVPVTGGQVMLK